MKYLFSLLLAGISLVSFAQYQNGQMRGLTNFTPEQSAVLQTKKMDLALDLNSTQHKQILAINKKRAVERKQKIEERRAMMGSKNRPSSDERFDMMNKMLDYQLAYQSQMKSILKSDQYTQWKTMQKKQMTKMNKKRKMMKGNSNHRGKSDGRRRSN